LLKRLIARTQPLEDKNLICAIAHQATDSCFASPLR